MKKKDFVVEGSVLKEYKGKEESVIIPDGIMTIGRAAFCGSSIVSITIPNSVKRIEDRAFGNCVNLKNVTFPNSVKHIGYWAFDKCINLKNVTFCGEINEMGNYVFQDCSQLEELEFPAGLTFIPWGAFANSGLKKIIIPDSVKEIGTEAFRGCSSLTSIELPNDLIHIHKGAFERSGIETISIPNGIRHIAEKAFRGSRLKTVYFHENIISIGEEAFSWCGSLKSVRLNKGLKKIGTNAFSYCGFKKVKIPEGVEEIGRSAFYKTLPSRRTKKPGLEITVPRSVEKINIYGFANESDTLIKCYENSLAHKLAIRDNIKYELMGTK